MISIVELHKSLAANEEFITTDYIQWAGGRGTVAAQGANASENWRVRFKWNNSVIHDFSFDPSGEFSVAQFDLPPGNLSVTYNELGGIDPVDFTVIITSVTALTQAP